jgi:glycosyltransferase involved in cell wall biosynthesis
MKSLAPLKIIRLRRNFGQTAAMDAGIKAATKDVIITMDSDLQNDPEDIPRLMEYMQKTGLDVVSGWRKSRKDTSMKRFVSRCANFLRSMIVHDGIHDSGCSLKAYRRECFEGITLYGEMHRFIPALLRIKGFTVGELVVNHRPRTAGVTKYNWKRAFKGFVDMLSLWFWAKYASRPLHLFGSLGIMVSSCGVVTGAISIVKYFQRGKVSDTAWPLLTVFLLIAGIQFLIFGLMADMMSKTYRQTTPDKSYSIREVLVNESDRSDQQTVA